MTSFKLEVANPVADSTVPRIEPAQRQNDLDGKTIGFYWNFKPGGDVGLDQVAAELGKRYPNAKFIRFDGDVGGSVRHVSPELADEIASKVYGVVGTTGDCGGCTSWLAHDMKELEKRGVPTVALVSDDFVEDHHRTGESYGIKELPHARMDAPLVSQTPQQVRDLVNGAIEEVVLGLTKSPASDTVTNAVELRKDPYFIFEGADSLDAFHVMNEELLDWQYGDGFPLIPATRAAVDKVLTGTTRDRGEVIGLMEPGDGVATVEKIAVNAVMAGCHPKHLPIVIAAIEALSDYHMQLREKAISTGAAAPMVVVNGPVRQYAGLNTGICMLGPGAPSRANTVIGRAVRLCMINVGHTFPGISDMDTIGSPNKYSLCVAENEERSPWEPYQTTKLGIGAERSSVTVGFVYGVNDFADYHSVTPEDAIAKFATAIPYMGVTSTGFWMVGHRSNPKYGNSEQEQHYLLLAPQHARVFQEAGWSKSDISEALHQAGRMPFSLLKKRLETKAVRSAHPDLAWLYDSPDTLVPVLEDAGCYNVIVAGSPGSNRSMFGWGQGGPVTKVIPEADLQL